VGFARPALCFIFCAGVVLAQNSRDDQQRTGSPSTDNRTTSPDTKGQMQPQGRTGPIATTNTRPGAPAASPQGETPPGTEAAPEGSSKTTVEPQR